MKPVSEIGSLNNKPDLQRCIDSLRTRAGTLRNEMKKIWANGDIDKLEEYQRLNESLRQTRIMIVELQYHQNII